MVFQEDDEIENAASMRMRFRDEFRDSSCGDPCRVNKCKKDCPDTDCNCRVSRRCDNNKADRCKRDCRGG